jgi:hypothetical protein
MDTARVCRDVREMLDFSHTQGDLKRHLVRDLARFVSPVVGAVSRLRDWRRAGKRLFVVTNSELTYASVVLDLVVGPDWRSLFAVVATSAAKPAFFDRRAISTRRVDSNPRTCGRRRGAHASSIEQIIGAAGERVLYAGDNRSRTSAPRALTDGGPRAVAEMGARIDGCARRGRSLGFAVRGGRRAELVRPHGQRTRMSRATASTACSLRIPISPWQARRRSRATRESA